MLLLPPMVASTLIQGGGGRGKGAYSVPITNRHMLLGNHVALFKFQLGNGRGIGPDALRSLWSRACGSTDISVSRQTHRNGFGARDTYLLHGSPRLKDLAIVEARLRHLLDESRLPGTLLAVHE